MDNVKLEKIQEFRTFLLDNDINYKELNLTHFHIFDLKGDLMAQVWPSTEKCVWQDPAKTFVGLEIVKKQIMLVYEEARKTVSTLRTEFDSYADQVAYARKIITVTELESGALEVQINDSALKDKYQYMSEAYDDQMRLKRNANIRILDFIIV